MKKLMTKLMVGVAVLGVFSICALGQESVVINGVQARRVVIAPPQTTLAQSIRTELARRYADARSGTAEYAAAQKLYYFYGARGFEPLWIQNGANGKAIFSSKAIKIMDVFTNAYLEGLNPEDYLTPDLNLAKDAADPVRLASLETAFSSAAILYARHAVGGRINPRRVSSSIDITPPRIDGAKFLLDLAKSNTPDEMLLDLSPKNREFVALRSALDRYYQDRVKEKSVIPGGTLLKPGMTDPRVPLLRERLSLPELANSTYDDQLAAAVRGFQEQNGLFVDGVIGPATISALNGGANVSRADLIANMERWRWMPRDLGKFYVFVNIPEFRLQVMDGDTPTYSTRVVVGKRDHRTPIFSDEIEHIVVNPYWNVPPSIARDEIGPRLAGNPGYLSARNMELLSGGKVINASRVDWSSNSISNFRIRQRPGRRNALGTIKFLFPNSHSVYLHDTPSRSLFSRSQRAYSHGCVRVQNPMDFAGALLAKDTSLSRNMLQSQFGTRERWNNLSDHIPVHLAYFTLRVDQDGHIHSFRDIYGHNTRLKQMLNL